MATIAVVLRFVPEQNERRLAARPKHREFLARLKAEGRLINGGPFADGTGALLVYRAADVDEVRGILAEDPYPAESYTVESADEWTTLFDF